MLVLKGTEVDCKQFLRASASITDSSGVVMKANKALKRLTKIEASLSNLIGRYKASDGSVQGLLSDAKATVLRAKKAVSLHASPRTKANASVKARKSKRRHPVARKGRKGTSLAAIERKPAQSAKKAAAKAKKSSASVVQKVVRTQAARPTPKKGSVRQLTKRAAAPSAKTGKRRSQGKVVTPTVAERTKPLVQGPEQVVPLAETPGQDRTQAGENIGVTEAKSYL